MHNNTALPGISDAGYAEKIEGRSYSWQRWHSVVALAVLLFSGLFAFAILQPVQVLPRISPGPEFAFHDQSAQPLSSQDLRGHFVLYSFTYTGCKTPCPQTGEVMRQIQQRLPDLDTDGIPVQLVTISFDPARDTPEKLAAYAQRLDADLRNWHFVTGAPDELKQVIGNGFGVYYAPASDANSDSTDVDFEFDPTFVLTDGWGIVRATYRTAAPDVEMVARDLGLLATEVRNSTGAARYVYETAHLFLCYPQ